jgi:hypothetical protein
MKTAEDLVDLGVEFLAKGSLDEARTQFIDFRISNAI